MLYLARKLTDNQKNFKTIYYSLVQPYFDYCDVVWGDCSKTRADKLQKLQNRAARIITRADYSIRSSDVLYSLEWSNLEERRKKHFLVTMFKVVNIKNALTAAVGLAFLEIKSRNERRLILKETWFTRSRFFTSYRHRYFLFVPELI